MEKRGKPKGTHKGKDKEKQPQQPPSNKEEVQKKSNEELGTGEKIALTALIAVGLEASVIFVADGPAGEIVLVSVLVTTWGY